MEIDWSTMPARTPGDDPHLITKIVTCRTPGEIESLRSALTAQQKVMTSDEAKAMFRTWKMLNGDKDAKRKMR